jgi:hypothetical protein
MRTAILTYLLAMFLAACGGGHASMRGTVVMKVGATDAHVCLAPGEVAKGDAVVLYRKDCRTVGKRTECKRVAVAEGIVIELVDDHYSVVRFPAGTTFAEGSLVEKAP